MSATAAKPGATTPAAATPAPKVETPFKRFVRDFASSKLAMFGLIVFTIIVLYCFLIPGFWIIPGIWTTIWDIDPNQVNFADSGPKWLVAAYANLTAL